MLKDKTESLNERQISFSKEILTRNDTGHINYQRKEIDTFEKFNNNMIY